MVCPIPSDTLPKQTWTINTPVWLIINCMATPEYEEQILQWRAKKYNDLVGENGWLALAGLSWLKPGRNLVGSNPMCEIALPERAPTFLGIIELNGKTVRL